MLRISFKNYTHTHIVPYEISCPQCGIAYKVEELEEKQIQCQDCDRIYNQKTMAKVTNPFVRDRGQE